MAKDSAAAAVPGAAQPPAFQEAPRCDVCNCSFSTFRRRHHCRCCGRTLCHEHSSYNMPLPQYGLYTDVRVCYDCFNKSPRSAASGQVNDGTSEVVANTTNKFSRLDVRNDDEPASVPEHQSVVLECNCGMPLCICSPPNPDPASLKTKTAIFSMQSQPRPKKSSSNQSVSGTKKHVASLTSNSSSFFGINQGTDGSSDNATTDYDISGEGLREAIKSGDSKAVKKLLRQGVDANYCDKQGFTLLHLAALFNQTEIALILMDNGASLEQKNQQGETPLDCAPAMLQYKMRQHKDELAAGK